jgi:polyhydroxybutyrate depolymerase
MKRWLCFGLLPALVFAAAVGGCSRSNLDAIGRAPTVDARSPDGSSDGSPDRSPDRSSDGSADGSADGSTDTVVCPSPVLKAGDTNETVQVGSTSRSYVLHIPAKYDGSKPMPLILDFHAINGSGSSERSLSLYPALTDPEGVVMAFPTGLAGPAGTAWNTGPCCVADVDDLAFAKALVDQVKGTACIDPKRVYAVGVSMGGGMAYYLACRAADVFAAVAPAAFDLVQETIADCKPRPIAVISFRGTADSVVPYEGGASSKVQGMPVTFLGAQGTFKKWAEIDQCVGSPSAEDSNGCSTYSNCSGGVEVILCTKQGGVLEFGNPSIAWPFLKRHPMP